MTGGAMVVDGRANPPSADKHIALLAWLALPGLAAIALLALDVTSNVALRSFTGNGRSETIEFVQFVWMPIVVFVGFWWTEATRGHIAVGAIVDGLPARIRLTVDYFTWILTIAFVVALSVGMVNSTFESFDQGEMMLTAGLPIWPVKLVCTAYLAGFAVLLVTRRPGTAAAAGNDRDQV